MTSGVSVVVEGHTDAHGPETSNESLSARRAEAVREYLVQRHRISVSKPIVKGYREQAAVATPPAAPAAEAPQPTALVKR